VFVYTYSAALPKDFDRNATHRVGGQLSHGRRRWAANDIFYFVSFGEPVVETKNWAETETCDQCHDPLSVYGGSATILTSIVRWKELISLVKKVYL